MITQLFIMNHKSLDMSTTAEQRLIWWRTRRHIKILKYIELVMKTELKTNDFIQQNNLRFL